MTKDIKDQLNELDNISDSQKDRYESQRLIQGELISFLQNQITKVDTKNDLRNSVVAILHERIVDTEEPMSTTQLLKLFEVLSKDENDSIANILSVAKDKQNTVINVPGGQSEKADDELSSAEVNAAKKLLNVFDVLGKLKKSEMSLDELEEEKNNS